MTRRIQSLADSEKEYLTVLDVGSPDISPPPIISRATSLYKQFKSAENIYLKPIPGGGEWHDVEAKKQKLYDEPWYFGAIARDRAERLVLDQVKGHYLVRASVNGKRTKKNYAITVAMGKHQFLHIAVSLQENGNGYKVDGELYPTLRDVLEHYSKNSYNNFVTLTSAIIQKAAPPRLPARNQEELPPNPPPRPSIVSGVSAISAISVAGKIKVDESGYSIVERMDFTSDHIYSSALSSDEESDSEDPPGDTGIYIAIDDITIDDGAKDATYLAPAKAKAQYIDTLAKSVKVLPLPKNVTTWSAAEVQKFLRINKLLAFKKPFYANGITGQELFKLKGHNFPSSRFSKKERDAFDAAIAQVNGKVLDTFVDGPFRKTSDVTLLAPPVPARPSQSPTN